LFRADFQPKNGGAIIVHIVPALPRRTDFGEWCGREESNLHEQAHSDLNAARLPFPPRPHCRPVFRDMAIFRGYAKRNAAGLHNKPAPEAQA
jgi:hypothetical protein